MKKKKKKKKKKKRNGVKTVREKKRSEIERNSALVTVEAPMDTVQGDPMLPTIKEVVELARVSGSGGDLDGGGIDHNDPLRWSLECMDTKGYDWVDHDVAEVPTWINARLTKGCSVETMHAILMHEGVAPVFEHVRVLLVIVVSLQLDPSGIYQMVIATWIKNTDHYRDRSDGSHGQCWSTASGWNQDVMADGQRRLGDPDQTDEVMVDVRGPSQIRSWI
ncbi:hypothetical protein NE237_008902 [Protea cynaroides]|uniref:Uncharacterized protein n=1 Tax=Protea cynaroides TaxID=273540 RepID=A0A9Q0KWS5_9MAGN|nr:hypothetical protein NE237_008902 [Protea cynaroides]